MGRIIGTVLGAILAIWLAVTAAGGILATVKTLVIIGKIAMAVFIVVWLVARAALTTAYVAAASSRAITGTGRPWHRPRRTCLLRRTGTGLDRDDSPWRRECRRSSETFSSLLPNIRGGQLSQLNAQWR